MIGLAFPGGFEVLCVLGMATAFGLARWAFLKLRRDGDSFDEILADTRLKKD